MRKAARCNRSGFRTGCWASRCPRRIARCHRLHGVPWPAPLPLARCRIGSDTRRKLEPDLWVGQRLQECLVIGFPGIDSAGRQPEMIDHHRHSASQQAGNDQRHIVDAALDFDLPATGASRANSPIHAALAYSVSAFPMRFSRMPTTPASSSSSSCVSLMLASTTATPSVAADNGAARQA